MGCAGALRSGWLGGTDVEFTVHGDRIAVYDLALEALGKRER